MILSTELEQKGNIFASQITEYKKDVVERNRADEVQEEPGPHVVPGN